MTAANKRKVARLLGALIAQASSVQTNMAEGNDLDSADIMRLDSLGPLAKEIASLLAAK